MQNSCRHCVNRNVGNIPAVTLQPAGLWMPGMVAVRITGTKYRKRGSVAGSGKMAEAGVIADKQGCLFQDCRGLSQVCVAGKIETGRCHVLRQLSTVVSIVRVSQQHDAVKPWL